MPALLRFAASVCVVSVLGFSTSANAQNLPALSSVTTVSGRWIGVFDTVRPDGSVAPDTAFGLRPYMGAFRLLEDAFLAGDR